MEPIRLTNLLANDQLLYFTSSSLTRDDRWLIFISDRTGNPNLFVLDQVTGEERMLTQNHQGYLKSYVYFDGRERQGLGKASVSLHDPSGMVFFIQNEDICTVDLNGRLRYLAKVPEGQVTAFTHVSLDGSRLVVPTTDARALECNRLIKGRPDYDIDQRVQQENLVSTLHVYDTRTGKEILSERVPRAWITHVQFCPTDPDLILYNHEWAADCGIRRVWLFNSRTGEHIRMRTEGAGRSREDWVCHEVWAANGEELIYHGGFAGGAYFVGKVNRDGSGRVEIAFPSEYRKYGHFNISPTGLLVCDGYYQPWEEDLQAGGRNEWRGGAWISLQRVNWQRGEIEWIPVCRHGSTWENQDCHPHPIFNHAGDEVYFTSNKEGRRAIYKVKIAG